MPRLTNETYLQQRTVLRADWFDDDAWTFLHLEPLEEMELHEYFAPTKNFTDEQAIAHRLEVTKKNSLLPQAAGRDYVRALRYLGKRPTPQPFVKTVKPKSGAGGKVIVRSILNPEPDLAALARFLVVWAKRPDAEDDHKAA